MGVLKLLRLSLIILSCSWCRALRDARDRPNFVLFFVDDLGYADCGFTGNPTVSTPNIDRLAFRGKVLTTWYSGCSVCSCSRAALMTGRQYPRTGVKTVFGATEQAGLPLEERTIAEQLKLVNYSTAIVGKWHLGQRPVYLPGNQGFDYYLGIPYSDDMGNGRYSSCEADQYSDPPWHPHKKKLPEDGDYAAWYLPLVYQEHNKTKIVEQPLDFSTLGEKYNKFATNFIEQSKDDPFFLYVPFSHVHVTSGANDEWDTQPNCQYASCSLQGTSKRGAFGDALAEVDAMIGDIYDTLVKNNLEENTVILFTSDNGPWNTKGTDGGNYGIFGGLAAGYTETGKGSTWEGGIREPAFAYWKGQIESFSRSAETISSMDVFPTFSRLAGVPLPKDVVLDGRDMADILLDSGKSQHDFLFFYGFCNGAWPRQGVSAVRHGSYKAHFCTKPGLDAMGWFTGGNVSKYEKYPLLFNVDHDPSEAFPLNDGTTMPTDQKAAAALVRILRAYAMEKATFTYGDLHPLPDGPGEGPHKYGLCCDRSTNCSCVSEWSEVTATSSLFRSIGTRQHHDLYHDILGETNHASNRQ